MKQFKVIVVLIGLISLSSNAKAQQIELGATAGSHSVSQKTDAGHRYTRQTFTYGLTGNYLVGNQWKIHADFTTGQSVLKEPVFTFNEAREPQEGTLTFESDYHELAVFSTYDLPLMKRLNVYPLAGLYVGYSSLQKTEVAVAHSGDLNLEKWASTNNMIIGGAAGIGTSFSFTSRLKLRADYRMKLPLEIEYPEEAYHNSENWKGLEHSLNVSLTFQPFRKKLSR